MDSGKYTRFYCRTIRFYVVVSFIYCCYFLIYCYFCFFFFIFWGTYFSLFKRARNCLWVCTRTCRWRNVARSQWRADVSPSWSSLGCPCSREPFAIDTARLRLPDRKGCICMRSSQIDLYKIENRVWKLMLYNKKQEKENKKQELIL